MFKRFFFSKKNWPNDLLGWPNGLTNQAWPKGPSRLGLTQPDPHSLAHWLSLVHEDDLTRSPPGDGAYAVPATTARPAAGRLRRRRSPRKLRRLSSSSPKLPRRGAPVAHTQAPLCEP
jgi:hypothetical protein